MRACLRVAALAAFACLGACFQSTSTICATERGDVWCAPATVCTRFGCAREAEVAACAGLDEGAACTSSETPLGVCQGDVCRTLVCGDGAVGPGEICDDGNTIAGDGCSSNCSSTEVCGNGVRDPHEACDDGNDNPYDACHTDCSIPRCGDGFVDTQFGEVCDDGNIMSNDGCAADCRSSELCGNGIIDVHVGEKCDDGNTDEGDSCHFNCQVPRCGDGITDMQFAEVCDDSNQLDGDGCAANCRSNEQCGNNFIDVALGEQCDNGGANSDAPNAACRRNCRVRACGDAIIDANEACDAGANNSDTTPNACRSTCQPAHCGDGVRDAMEVCDDGNIAIGDGCSAACQSDETCGNNIIDVGQNEQCDSGVYGQSNDGCASRCQIEAAEWRDIPNQSPFVDFGTQGGRAVLDTPRQVIVYFGGSINGNTSDATWEQNGRGWRQVRTPVAPKPRVNHGMAYDRMRRRVVLFGGSDANYSPLGDTWEYDGVVWSPRNLSPAPPARAEHGMVYDSSRNRVVVFGGRGTGAALLNDTWEYDGAAWTKRTTATSPPPAKAVTLAHDPVRNRIIMTGTTAAAPVTYEFNGSNWFAQSGSSSPIGSIVYAANFSAVIGVGDTTGLYVYRNGTWIAQYSLPFNNGGAIAIEPLSGHPLYIGGELSCVFCGDSRAMYLLLTTGAEPFYDVTFVSGTASTAATYLAHQGRLVVFGGTNREGAVITESNELLTSDGAAWRREPSTTYPDERGGAAIQYDSSRQRLVMFGGTTGSVTRNDTWLYSNNNWQSYAGLAPPPRTDAAMVYDSKRRVTVLFGGGPAANQELNDTWEFSTAWTRVTPATTPSARRGHRMAYDSKRGITVLYGGEANGVVLQDLWEYNGTTWSSRNVTPGPGPRSLHGMTFDPVRGETCLIGGKGSAAADATLWCYNGSRWLASGGGAAQNEYGGQLIYDSLRQRLVMINGGTRAAVSQHNAAFAADTCFDAAVDSDGDGLFGCGSALGGADPDCWGRCSPECSPTTTAISGGATLAWPASCAVAYPTAMRCGDGTCQLQLEDYRLCPSDCPAP